MKTDLIGKKKYDDQKNQQLDPSATYGKYKLKSKTEDKKICDTIKDSTKKYLKDLKFIKKHKTSSINNDTIDKKKTSDLIIDFDNINLILKQLANDIKQKKNINIINFYQSTTANFKNNPISIAYFFLKKGKKIPNNYIKYVLFPFLALKYISEDLDKLAENTDLIKALANDLDIKDYHNVSFENILQLKQKLQKKYGIKEYQQQDVIKLEKPSTQEISDTNSNQQITNKNLTPIALDAPKNTDTTLDDDDVEHIQHMVKTKKINKATKYDIIYRIKRYFLHKKSEIALSEISFIIGLLTFVLLATGQALIIGVFTIFVVRFILAAVFCAFAKIKQYRYQKFVDTNLAQGLEILKKDDISADDLKLIKKLREKQSYLFRTMHLDEIYNLYAEVEKMSNQLNILNKKTQKKLQDKIDIIELEYYINKKEISIDKYMAIANNIFEFSDRELQKNTEKWNDIFKTKLKDAFSKKSKKEQEDIKAKIKGKKNFRHKVEIMRLLKIGVATVEDDSSGITAENFFKRFMKIFKNIVSSKILGGVTEATVREICLSFFCRRTFIGVISSVMEAVRSSILFYHSYYITLIFLLLNIARIRILSKIDKKRLAKIAKGKKEQTGILFGLINARDRTNREEVSTLTAVQKNKTLDVLKLMEKHNSFMKKRLKLIEKNKEISCEKLYEMHLEFKYLILQASCQLVSNATDFLHMLQDKMSVLSADLADELIEDN